MFDLFPAEKKTAKETILEVLNNPKDFTIHAQTDKPGCFLNLEYILKDKKVGVTISGQHIPFDSITGIFYFNSNTFHKVLL